MIVGMGGYWGMPSFFEIVFLLGWKIGRGGR